MITQTNLELIIKQTNDKILENINKGLNLSINDSRSLFYNYSKPYFNNYDWESKRAFSEFKRNNLPIFTGLFLQGVSSNNSIKVNIPVINKYKSISSISFDEIKNITF